MKRKKVLIVASTASMIKQFNRRNINILKSMGYDVNVAANFSNPGTISKECANELRQELLDDDVQTMNVNFSRGMGSPRTNLRAYKQIMNILKKEHYSFVHVHSALASVITRIAAWINKTPTLYTVHGFQFMKGGSKLRWIVFFPIEWALAFITERIITINDDDYKLVNRYFHTNVSRINGVGIDYDRFFFSDDKKTEIVKNELGLDKLKKIFITVGELSDRKNQILAVNAFSKIDKSEWMYVLVGLGPNKKNIEFLIKDLGLSNNVLILGYREDVQQLYHVADYSIFPSQLEGLLTSGMESLAAGVPIIYSNVRGIKDYMIDDENGIKIETLDVNGLQRAIQKAIDTPKLKKKIMDDCATKSALQFDKEKIDKTVKKVYGLMR